jgi:hypothetical protein
MEALSTMRSSPAYVSGTGKATCFGSLAEMCFLIVSVMSGETGLVKCSSGNVVSLFDSDFRGEVHCFFSRASKIIKKTFLFSTCVKIKTEKCHFLIISFCFLNHKWPKNVEF